MDFISLIKSCQKTFKYGDHCFATWGSARKGLCNKQTFKFACCVQGKVINGTSPSLCGRQVVWQRILSAVEAQSKYRLAKRASSYVRVSNIQKLIRLRLLVIGVPCAVLRRTYIHVECSLSQTFNVNCEVGIIGKALFVCRVWLAQVLELAARYILVNKWYILFQNRESLIPSNRNSWIYNWTKACI